LGHAHAIELAIPKLRQGSYFPSFLEPRKRSERAPVAVVQEAYVNGASTRKVDRLVESLGVSGMSKDQVSRLCRALDEQVRAFRERPLEGAYPYVCLDGKVEKVRDGGHVRQKCLVIAYAVHESGRREVIGLDVGEAETESFWREFRRGLRARGLSACACASRTATRACKRRSGRSSAVRSSAAGALLRSMLGHCSKAQQPMISAAIRQVFGAASGDEARARLAEVVDRLEGPTPKVARLLLEAEPDLLAFYAFSKGHWSKLKSTNPLERVNREIGRRTDVVGIFPNDAALIRLAGALLIEQSDE
jgi:transposase-like protein